jgi:hypothetical protein
MIGWNYKKEITFVVTHENIQNNKPLFQTHHFVCFPALGLYVL